jgi:hypothetical protein
MIKKTILLIFLYIIIGCNLKNEEDKKKEQFIQNILLNQIQSECKPYYLSEETTFRELHQKNVFESCLRCHNSNNRSGNLDLKDYSQTRALVVPYNPEESLLYQKVTIGSMKDYSNSCINLAIKKWIEVGAKE